MKKIITIFCLAILLFSLVGCTNTISAEKRADETVYNVKTEDQEMNSIIENARNTVGVFLKELNKVDSKGTDFTVKYPFETDPGSVSGKEHIWLANIEQKNGKYFGIVINDPFYIKNMKYGDRVEFNINEISDWKYVEDGKLVGGKSIIYLYNQMSEQEKLEFEKSAGFKIK